MTESSTNITPIRAGRGAGSNGGGDDYGERLARIEAKLECLATKKDIQSIKVWMLGGVVASAMLALGVVKLFFS